MANIPNADTARPDGLAHRTVGAIAASLPGSTAVFRAHGLDFCCGGDATLADAAARRGVPLATIEAELRDLVPEPAATPADPTALIQVITTRYHNTHRREIPELVRLARRVEARHGARPDAPHGLADALEALGAELETHMRKEEHILFPLMLAAAASGATNPMIGHPIARMRLEHDDHGERLAEVDRLTAGGALPGDACGSWRALYAGVRKLADDLMGHVHLENNVLFPQFADPDAPLPKVCQGFAPRA